MSLIIKSLSVRNFLSVGNVTQAINFDRKDLTLVLGENLDLGGDDNGARNGTGKCLGMNTIIKLRNTISGEIFEITMGELYAKMEQNQATESD